MTASDLLVSLHDALFCHFGCTVYYETDNEETYHICFLQNNVIINDMVIDHYNN